MIADKAENKQKIFPKKKKLRNCNSRTKKKRFVMYFKLT